MDSPMSLTFCLVLFTTLCLSVGALENALVGIVGKEIEIDLLCNTSNVRKIEFLNARQSKSVTICSDEMCFYKKYTISKSHSEWLKLVVGSLNLSDSGLYWCHEYHLTTVVILDPNPQCALSKAMDKSKNVSVILKCFIAYAGMTYPALQWAESGFDSSNSGSCDSKEHHVTCYIPISNAYLQRNKNIRDVGSTNYVAMFTERCDRFACRTAKNQRFEKMGYAIRIAGSVREYLWTFQCSVFTRCLTKREIHDNLTSSDSGNEKEHAGFIGALIALSIVVVVFGVLMVHTCFKTMYLRRRLDNYAKIFDTMKHRLNVARPSADQHPANEEPGTPSDNPINIQRVAEENLSHRPSTQSGDSVAEQPEVFALPHVHQSPVLSDRPQVHANQYVQNVEVEENMSSLQTGEYCMEETGYAHLVYREPTVTQPPTYTALKRSRKKRHGDTEEQQGRPTEPTQSKQRHRSKEHNPDNIQNQSTIHYVFSDNESPLAIAPHHSVEYRRSKDLYHSTEHLSPNRSNSAEHPQLSKEAAHGKSQMKDYVNITDCNVAKQRKQKESEYINL